MKKTIIYTKTGCPYCASAMDAMRDEKEEYDERNCTDSPKFIDDLVSISGGRVVPVIVRGDDVQVGFGGG